MAIKVGFCSHYCFLCINDFEIVMCDFLYHFQDYVVDALTYQKNKKKHGMVDALMHAVLSSKVECRSIWLSTAPTPAASF